MYEPLETTVQPNQQVWITKVQSQPQLRKVILREDNIDYFTTKRFKLYN